VSEFRPLYARVLRRSLADIALILACLGAAIPYGTYSGRSVVLELNWLEWGVSVLAGVAVIGLLLDLFHPWGAKYRLPGAIWGNRLHESGLAFMVAGTAWAIATVYHLVVPGDLTITWRLGHALPSFGWTFLSLCVWRLIVRSSRIRPWTPT
jgi:hypothetical protein